MGMQLITCSIVRTSTISICCTDLFFFRVDHAEGVTNYVLNFIFFLKINPPGETFFQIVSLLHFHRILNLLLLLLFLLVVVLFFALLFSALVCFSLLCFALLCLLFDFCFLLFCFMLSDLFIFLLLY
mgnify:CR=1 FL=1